MAALVHRHYALMRYLTCIYLSAEVSMATLRRLFQALLWPLRRKCGPKCPVCQLARSRRRSIEAGTTLAARYLSRMRRYGE